MASSSSSSGIIGLPLQSLKMNGLEPWMDDAYLRECFSGFENEIVSVNIVTKNPDSIYAFMNFIDNVIADVVFSTYQGKAMPGTAQCFCLERGRGFKPLKETTAASEEGNYKLVVAGALPKDITAEQLQQFLSTKFPSVKDAEVHTNESQELYGVVTFTDKHERDLATIILDGAYFKRGEEIKVQHFFYKDTAVEYHEAAYPSTHPEDADRNGSTIYIQNLEEGVSEADLRDKYSSYGEIIKVTIRGCALIQFADKTSADEALHHLNDELVLQNSLSPLTLRNSKSVPVASSVEEFNDMTRQESPKGVMEFPNEDESGSGFRMCDEEFTDEKVTVEKQEEGKQVLDALCREEDEGMPKVETEKEAELGDESGSGFRTCDEEFSDEKVVLDALCREEDEGMPKVETEKEAELGDESGSGFRTCDEEFSDEKLTVEKQEEEGKQVLYALSREEDEEMPKVETEKEAELGKSKRSRKRERYKKNKEEKKIEHQSVVSKLWKWCVSKWHQLFNWVR